MSVHFHDSLTSGARDFRLRGGLFVYTGAGGALVTCHDVHVGEDGEPRLLSGHPLTRDLADMLVRGIQDAAPIRTVLPGNVLMWDGLRLAWWAQTARRRIWFDRRQQPQLQHVSRKEVLHPALLFVADPGRLHVYALATWERPGPETPVYQAPYLNVYADGWVCAGGVSWPGSLDVAKLDDWERAWFDSEGTHATAPELTRFPGGHDALWEAMLTADTFPYDTLVPTGLTVLDAINRTSAPQGGPAVREVVAPVAEGATL